MPVSSFEVEHAPGVGEQGVASGPDQRAIAGFQGQEQQMICPTPNVLGDIHKAPQRVSVPGPNEKTYYTNIQQGRATATIGEGRHERSMEDTSPYID